MIKENIFCKILLLSFILGSSSFICSSDGDQALINDIIENKTSEAKELIKSNKIDLNAKGEYGRISLIRACTNNHKKIVKMLIEANANLNIQDNYGSTALIWACFMRRKEIVEILIDAGADINIQNERNRTAFDYVQNKPRIFSILNGAKENRLSNCHCKHCICSNCKNIMQTLPVLKVDKSNLNDYIEKVEIIINNSQITEKLAIRMRDELIAFNDGDSIKLKNRLRLLSDAECKECNALLCRECKINVNNC